MVCSGSFNPFPIAADGDQGPGYDWKPQTCSQPAPGAPELCNSDCIRAKLESTKTEKRKIHLNQRFYTKRGTKLVCYTISDASLYFLFFFLLLYA